MEIVFRITKEDLRELALFLRRNKRYLSLIGLLVLFCLCGVWMGAFLWSLGDRIASVMFVLLFAVLPVIVWFYPAIQARRTMRAYPYMQEECRILISEEHLTVTWKSIRSEMLWSTFNKWAETPTLFLLRAFDGNYQLLPKRAFLAQGSDEFRHLLKRKISIPAGMS